MGLMLIRLSSSELECSIRGFGGAIYRCCSSVTRGKIKFDLFSQQLAHMFADRDPYSSVDLLVLEAEEFSIQQQIAPPEPPATPVPEAQRLPLAPQVESWNAASSCDGAGRLGGPSSPRNGDGWYVAYRAILPGVYYGV